MLKPPKNPRHVTPAVCARCLFFSDLYGDAPENQALYISEGEQDLDLVGCVRPDGPVWVRGDEEEWSFTCDRFKG